MTTAEERASPAAGGARRAEHPAPPSAGLGIGRFLRLSKDPLGFLTALRQHGTFVRYRLGPRTLYLASDPEIVHEVLVAKASAFHKDRGTEMMRPLLGRGLLTSEDEQHRRQRRALQPAFHKARVADYARVMAEEARRARDSLAAAGEVDVLSLAMRTTLEAVVDRIVREHGASGFFSLAQAAGLSRDELRDTALTLLLAGHETTAVALCWTLFLLSQHPAIEARLESEIDSALQGGAPGPGDLERLPYLQRVLSESMRLYPPAWAVGRLAQGDVELSAGIVRRGETVILSQWVIHRDAALWPDPLRFDPDRFQRPPVHRFAYFSFGGGPRVCIGDGFAWTELGLLLATLVQRFRFRLAEGQRIEPSPRVTLRLKYGLRMTVAKRAVGTRQAATGSGDSGSGSGSSSSTGSQW